ncbi:MAG: hypothetical protein JWP87_3754 [Labilithrix sp.]|nr:hypothetical protein [Labilithrix sp.]
MRAIHRALVVAIVAGLVSTACSTILGIDFPPLLDGETGDGSSDASGDEASPADAGSDTVLCPLSEPLPCRLGCPHAFCDDFEDASAVFPQWISPPGAVNPFVLVDGSVGTSDPGAPSSSRGLSIVLSGGNRPSAALLFHRLPSGAVGDPTTLDGIRVVFDARVESADLADAGGPISDAGSSALAFLGSGSDTISGPGVGLSGRDIFFVAATDVLRKSNTELSAQVSAGNLKVELGVWVRLSLFAGTPARARALGYDNCPDVPYVFAAGYLVAQICVTAPPVFSLASLPTNPTLILGPILAGPGSISLRYDNVFIDVFHAP